MPYYYIQFLKNCVSSPVPGFAKKFGYIFLSSRFINLSHDIYLKYELYNFNNLLPMIYVQCVKTIFLYYLLFFSHNRAEKYYRVLIKMHLP